jgi:hypothetical protein
MRFDGVVGGSVGGLHPLCASGHILGIFKRLVGKLGKSLMKGVLSV